MQNCGITLSKPRFCQYGRQIAREGGGAGLETTSVSVCGNLHHLTTAAIPGRDAIRLRY